MAQRIEEPTPLPATSYAVLGLLSRGEMSGYDMQKWAQKGIGHFFWRPAKSQIYSELRRLMSLGYASEREVEQEGRPDKRLYCLTPQGDQALREWLNAVDAELPWNTLLLKVFFARLMDPEVLVAHITAFRGQMEATLAEYQTIEERIRRVPDAFHPYLTLQFGLLQTRAAIAWTESVLRQLNEREGSRRPGH